MDQIWKLFAIDVWMEAICSNLEEVCQNKIAPVWIPYYSSWREKYNRVHIEANAYLQTLFALEFKMLQNSKGTYQRQRASNNIVLRSTLENLFIFKLFDSLKERNISETSSVSVGGRNVWRQIFCLFPDTDLLRN
jgi:hypothetical protein